MSKTYVIYSTFGSEHEAFSVAESLVEKRLVACVNVHGGVTSFYRWEGQTAREQEVVLSAKTTAEKLEAAMAEVKHLHSYELPCIIASPIEAGFPPFIQWIRDEVA